MKIIFTGTSGFADTILQVLLKSKHQIVAVCCPPDKPKGRGLVVSSCPVKITAIKHNLPLYQPHNLKNSKTELKISNFNSDIMLVVAYGKILPENILNIPKYGCINIHPSLLPRWRGASPIERAILAGDKITGISIIKMNHLLDAGAILFSKKCSITETDTAGTLNDKLTTLATSAIIQTLDNFSNIKTKPQSKNNISYAKKLQKIETWINWEQTASKINRQILAFNPRPIAKTKAITKQFKEKILSIIEAQVITQTSKEKPGTIISQHKAICDVATTKGIIRLKKVQLAGKKPILIKDFNNAYKLIKLS